MSKKELFIGIVFLIFYCGLYAFLKFFTDSNLQQVYYESGFWQFLKESVIKAIDNAPRNFGLYGRFSF